MKEFGTLDSREKMIATPRNRWWPQAANQEGDKSIAAEGFDEECGIETT